MTKQIKCTMKAKNLTMECARNEFALAVKTWRLRAALTQEQVARRWGVSRFTSMRAERARALTWEMAYRLFNKLSYELEHEHDEIHDDH